MKIETSESGPKLNLLKPDGVRDQASAANVDAVLLADNGWVPIIPGTFHFYKTAGDKPVPFVQFDVVDNGKKIRVEVFPTAIAGLSYPCPDDE
jgi:hypothetical protein